MKKNLFLFFFIFATLFLFSKSVFAYVSPGSSLGFVSDFAQVLNEEQKNTIAQKIETLQKETSTEIAVVTLNTLSGDSIEFTANELFREWGIGNKTNNNGVLFLVVPSEKKVRIEVGYGLEGALPDALAGQIIRNDIIPPFQKNDYATGIENGVTSIISVVKGEYTTPVSKKPFVSTADLIGGVFFFFIFIFNIFVSIVAPSKSWWLGGVIGALFGFLVGFFVFTVITGAILGGVCMILGFVVDYFVSKNYTNKGLSRHDTWHGSGGWWLGGGGSSGGGFGGFSGGSSGGGGSSGSW